MKPWLVGIVFALGISAGLPAQAQYARYYRRPHTTYGRYRTRTAAAATPVAYNYGAYTYSGTYRASAANLKRRSGLIRRTDTLARRATVMNRQRRLTTAHLGMALARLQQIRNDLIASGGNPVRLSADTRLLTRASHAITSWAHGDTSFWR